MPSPADYLSRPLTYPEPAVLDAIERGPIDAGDALPESEVDRLLDHDGRFHSWMGRPPLEPPATGAP